MGSKRERFLLANVAAALAVPALAQTQTQAPEVGFIPEEIVVTARRRSEPLQETPVAVTALSAESLSEKSVVNVQDLGRLAPSLDIRAGGGSQTQSFIFIRGIGQASDNPALEPGVAIYVDDVFLPRSQGGLFDLNDVAQVEVLRGPQGTLYGKNAIGGAVKLTSVLPGPERTGSISAGVGNLNERRLAVAYNEPLVDEKLFVRVSGSMRRRDGYNANSFGGARLDDIDSAAGRVILRYTPAQHLDLLLSADGYRDRSIDVANRLLATAPTPALAAIEASAGSLSPYILNPGEDPSVGGGSDVRSDPDLGLSPFVDSYGMSLTATWTGDEVTLKSISAYREFEGVRMLDVEGTPLRVLNIADHTRQDQFSQELQMSGALADDTFEYIGGVFYYVEDIAHDARQTVAPLGARSDRLNMIETRSIAGYLNVTWNATDRLSAALGARYTREQRALRTTRRSLPALNALAPSFGAEKTFTDVSPKGEISYRFTDEVFGYVSASKGFKSGGFNNQANNSTQLVPFDPEIAWNYELGLKTQVFERRLTFNVAAFYMDYDDLQQNVFTTANGQLLQTVANAARARIYGAEVESSVALSSGLRLFGSLTYNDAGYDRFEDAVLGDLSDRELRLPKHKYLIGAQYDINFSDGMSGRLSADYAWRSAAYLDTVNTAVLRQPSYELVNARATWAFDDSLELSVYGKNLTDTRAIQSGSQALASLGLAWGGFHAPRTYGLDMAWRF